MKTLVPAIDAAKSLAGKILLRAEPTRELCALACEHGVVSLSLRHSGDDDDSLADAAAALSEFALATNGFGLHAYVFNLDVIGLVKAAAAAGISPHRWPRRGEGVGPARGLVYFASQSAFLRLGRGAATRYCSTTQSDCRLDG